MNQIIISKLISSTPDNSNLNLGLWVLELDDLNNNVVFQGVNVDSLEEYNAYCDRLIDKIITSTAKSLNSYHNVNFSLSFWRVLLLNWVTCIVNNLHFYYLALSETNKLKGKYVIYIDDNFIYNKLSHPMQYMDDKNYIHSLISFLIKNVDFKNIQYKYKKVISERKPILHNESFISKAVWRILNREKAEILTYNIVGLRKIDLLKIYLKFSNVAISHKPIHCEYDSPNRDRSFSLTHYSYGSDDLEKVIISFIEKNIPTTVLESFDLLYKQAVDFKFKKVGIASPGFYLDEQLIELALIKENNNGKIIQIQEAGNGMEKYSASSNFLYKPSDYFLTWGWDKHCGFSKLLVKTPSRLSVLKDTHKEKYDKILYQTKFSRQQASLYDSNTITNFIKYYQNRISFLDTFENLDIVNKVILKMHHSKHKGFNENFLMEGIYPKYIQYIYDNKALNFNNVAIVYTDYLSAVFYEAMVCNVPIIMCFDEDIVVADSNLQFFLNKFADVGVVFNDPVNAANKIIDIYDQRVEFWNHSRIQDIRREFLHAYIHLSSDWVGDMFKTIENIYKTK